MSVLLILFLLAAMAGGYFWYRGRQVEPANQPANVAETLYEEGLGYRKGLGVDFDYARARELWQQAADLGNLPAQYDLGLMLEQGLGGPKDEAGALQWIARAADGGERRATLAMGKRRLAAGASDAVDWLQRAADAGSAEGQYLLAMVYGDRNSPFWHSAKALVLLNKAAEQHYPAALFALSEMYEKGAGVTRDIKVADRWLYQAAQQGMPEAQLKLAKYYLTGAFGHNFPLDYHQALEWFRRAAANGVAEAVYEVGVRYERNEGVDAMDKVQAAECFRRAAEMGYPPAQYRLGQLHMYGDTVSKNMEEAHRWFAAAAAQGHPEATKQMAALRLSDAKKTLLEPGSDPAKA